MSGDLSTSNGSSFFTGIIERGIVFRPWRTLEQDRLFIDKDGS